LVRNVLAPAGHAAWTGLVCAGLWRARAHPSSRTIVEAVGAFILAVGLHATWDAASSGLVLIVVGVISFGLLAARLVVASSQLEPARARAQRSP
jgi:RsiW-degrading membrane proteinase PrsW (M82 family)